MSASISTTLDTPVFPKPGKIEANNLVEGHADYLFRYAISRVRDVSTAEDLVQETLLAAFRKIDTFSNRSTMRTWLTSIMKNKIYDHFRGSRREETFDCTDDENAHYFQPDGSWKPQFSPTSWNSSPSTAVENREFWEIVNKALVSLPQKTAEAFVLREIEGMDSKEVCRRLRVSKNNLWVMLHRARMLLRHEIDSNFFMSKG